MKKFSYISLGVIGLLGIATSCDSPMDENPVFQTPTTFVLNTPATASQYYDLSASDDMTINFTCSQPDYGFAAATIYTMQVSLTEDFEEYEEFEDEFSACVFEIAAADLAEAICVLRGIESEDDYTDEPARAVYFRARARLLEYEESEILSNVVCLEQVKEYCAIQTAGYIYLVGQPTGWTEPSSSNATYYADYRLYETTIGNKIYTGVFEINSGEAMFRFYTDLTGWDGGDSYGIQEDDNSVDIELDDDGIYSGSIIQGKGSYNIPDWEGGSLKMTVNMSNTSNMTVTFEAGGTDYTGLSYIFLIGAPSGWAEPSEDNASTLEDWKLYDLESNGVYTGTFTIDSGSFQFRFYTDLTGWDGGDSYGSQEDDASIEIEFEDGVYSGEGVAGGKGSWYYADWEGGKVSITVDTTENLVIFEQQ